MNWYGKLGILCLVHVMASAVADYVCNPSSSIQTEMIRFLKGNRPSIPYHCPNTPVKTLYELKKYINNMHNKPSGCISKVCLMPSFMDCKEPKAKQYDWDQNINLYIETSTDEKERKSGSGDWKKLNTKLLYSDFIIKMKIVPVETDFEVRKSSTLWRKFRFDVDGINHTACRGAEKDFNCDNTLFNLPSRLFEGILEVQGNGFITEEGVQLHADVKYELSKQTRNNLVRGKSGYAFQSSGCSIPLFRIRVEWFKHSQIKIGSLDALETFANVDSMPPQRRLLSDTEMMSWDDNGRKLLQLPTMDCWKRVIKITEAYNTGASSMRCQTTQSMNQMRYFQGIKADVQVTLLNQIFAKSVDNSIIIYYSATYVRQLEECAYSNIGSSWKGNDLLNPGFCGSCSDSNSIAIKQRNLMPRACESLGRDIGRECCFQCKDGFIPTTTSLGESMPNCIRSCMKGYRFTGHTCVQCESGKYSLGGTSETCSDCVGLGLINHRLLPRQGGCSSCGTRFFLENNRCVPCAANEYVPVGSQFCRSCPSDRAFYLPAGMENMSCVLCPAGTRGDEKGGCVVCERNSISQAGALQCTVCSDGTYSNANRTKCLACPALRGNLSEYHEPGCDHVRCIPTMAYAVGNPFNADGCTLCSNLGFLPIGTYRPTDSDCSSIQLCSNKPQYAIYTTAAPYPSTACEWRCIPGYQKVGSSCVACSIAGFSLTKHVWIDQCEYNCQPMKYRDSLKDCGSDCVDLIAQERNGLLFRRISEYGSKPRLNYVIGVCGSDERVAIHDIPLLRLGRYAYVQTQTSSIANTCGNSVLNTNEECDDGNTMNGDGCSHLCKIEMNKYWDCDLIGQLCQSDCGWPVHSNENWGISLYGYVLPRPNSSGLHSCEGITYREVKNKGAGERKIWMDQHFVPCDCYGNLFRQTSYEECTPENRGCIECPADHFYHDLRRECIECGKSCLPGFRKWPDALKSLSKCRNDTSYRFREVFSHQIDVNVESEQAVIGCYPCSTDNINVEYIRWLPGEHLQCQYQCRRDSTGVNITFDTFCIGTLDEVSGACSGCQLCSIKKQQVMNSIDESQKIGRYMKGCVDVTGYSWEYCDLSILPANADFSGPAVEIGDSKGCPWRCRSGYYVYEDKLCLPEFAYVYNPLNAAHPCPKPSDVLMPVIGQSNMFICVPCEGSTPFPYQVWRTRPPLYERCEPECELGLSWRNDNDLQCVLCSEANCASGEYKVPCGLRKDSSCEACVPLLDENSEYVNAGDCLQRCSAGYYLTSENKCVTCRIECEPGFYRSSNCSNITERGQVPQCIQCPPLKANEIWKIGSMNCETSCQVNYVFTSRCELCKASLCGYGSYGTCIDVMSQYSSVIIGTQLTCIDCKELGIQLKPNYVFVGNGTCSHECAPKYVNVGTECRHESEVFRPPENAGDDEEYDANMVDIIYPIRTMEHS